MPQKKDSIRSVFDRAAEFESAEQRSTYLDRACAGDADLREQVESLLAAYDQADGFLEDHPVSLVPTADMGAGGETVGNAIGRYRLRELIAEGGMGAVYVAEQLRPVTRKVALKIIKPGMDTRQVIVRFEAERQVLAMMDHPNIAKVLDAGSTESGRPFFVMDLVRGLPITEYCDKQKLSTHQRLELYITICHAVHHAHQKGIIHRDIKPSNVLVTRNGDRAVPKVIDFGVAKATNRRLTERSIYTQFNQMIGTPLYMSPEQAEMSELDVDTRSDVYSLGIVLYELLTGSTPMTEERLSSASFDEVRRIIREEEPPKPSTRISTLEPQALSTVTTRRGCEPRQLHHIVRGELDWIVMKALDKDRARRYESASALAADVQRYLDNEPVVAGPPSVLYRFRKFARRNAAAMTTAGLVFLAILLGFSGTSWQAWRATKERDEKQSAMEGLEVALLDREEALAESEANRRLARQAVDEMYARVAVEWLVDQPHLTKLQRELLSKAGQFYEQLPAPASDDPVTTRASADTRFRAGRVFRALYEHDRAEPLLRESLRMYEAMSHQSPESIDDALATAAAAHELGQVLSAQGSSSEAQELFRRAISVAEKLDVEHAGRKDVRKELIAIYSSLAGAIPIRHPVTSAEQISEQVEYFTKAVRLGEELVEDFPDDPRCQLKLASALISLGGFTLEHAERERRLQRAIRITASVAEDYPMLSKARGLMGGGKMFLADSLRQSGRVDESIKMSHEALRQIEMLMIAYPDVSYYRIHLASQHLNLANSLVAAERFDDAEAEILKAVSLCTQLPTGMPVEGFRRILSSACGLLTAMCFRREDYQSALEHASRIIEADETCVLAYRSRASSRAELGEFEAAVVDLQTAIELNPTDASSHNELGGMYYNQRKYEAAEQAFSKVIEFEPKRNRGYGNRGETRMYMGRYEDAFADLTQGTERGPKDPYAHSSMAWLLVAGPPKMRDPRKALAIAQSGPVLENQKSKILGGAWYRIGQYGPAKEALIDAVENTDESSAHQLGERLFFLAMTCHKLGEHEPAHQWFTQAVTWIEENAGPEDGLLRDMREEASAELSQHTRKTAGENL